MFLDAGMVDPVQLQRLIEQLETIAPTVRQHDAFLNSYAPEDKEIYDDYPTR